MKHVRRTWMVALALVATAGLAGCATTGSAEDDSSTVESDTSSSETDDEMLEGETKTIQKPAHFEDVLGTPLERGQQPTGCLGSWDPVGNKRFPGDVYFCSEFRGPEQWGEIPVTFSIQDGELSLLAVQIYYDGVEEAREEYQDLSASMLDRCSRKTGFDRNIVLDCDGYFVDISWQGHHETGQMEVIYSKEFEDVP